MTDSGQQSRQSERVAVYIDGYNVYYGLRSKGWKRYLWLDYRSLFDNQLRQGQELVVVNYFTALGRRQSTEAAERQRTYLSAIKTVGGVNIKIAGKFETRPWKCMHCDQSYKRPQEKMTDVAIAVQLVGDAHSDIFDTAWLMSADADLVPAVNYVNDSFPQKLIVALPPRGRRSDHLVQATGNEMYISKSRHSQAQLPDTIMGLDGRVLKRPPEWS
ncbi:MAG: NYN domain-containing protein [Actinobacteria bacterium]|nr:NYN domain-containing protein [Actinomycetota bacterium]